MLTGQGGSGGRGLAVEVDLDVLGGVARRQEATQVFEQVGRQVDVESTAGFVVEVGVGSQVGAVAGGGALEVHRPHEFVLHQGLQAVVDGGQRDGRHDLLHANEDLVGGGVVALLEQDLVNGFALAGRAQAALREALGQRWG